MYQPKNYLEKLPRELNEELEQYFATLSISKKNSTEIPGGVFIKVSIDISGDNLMHFEYDDALVTPNTKTVEHSSTVNFIDKQIIPLTFPEKSYLRYIGKRMEIHSFNRGEGAYISMISIDEKISRVLLRKFKLLAEDIRKGVYYSYQV